MHAAIYAILAANAGVTALVSTRIYKDEGLQNATYPCVVFYQSDGWSEETLTSSSGIRYAEYEVMAFASTHIAAYNVAEAVRTALNRYNGSAGGVTVLDIKVTGESSEKDDNIGMFLKSIEILATYN
jgi:hypothetical protein